MKKTLTLAILVLLTACNTRLAPNGPYSGMTTNNTNLVGTVSAVNLDKVAFIADRTIATADDLMKKFVLWEYQNRSSVPIEVTKVADTIRSGYNQWMNDAIVARDSYVAFSSPENKSKLDGAIAVLNSIVSQINIVMK